MAGNVIPEKVVNYNVYDDAEKMVGVAAEITLPKLETMTETISGAGIAGEFESPTPGHFASMTTEINFRTITDQSFRLMVPGGRVLTFRASQQGFDVSAGRANYRALKITMKVLPKGVEPGVLSVGKPTDTKNTLEVIYLKIEEGDKVLLEVDKLNFIYAINGVDVFAEIRKHL